VALSIRLKAFRKPRRFANPAAGSGKRSQGLENEPDAVTLALNGLSRIEASYSVRSSAYPVKLTHNTSRIANRQTIGWDVSGHDATRADSGVASNANSGKDYRVRADPHVIFDDNWCGWRRYLTLFDAMLVPIDDKQAMTQQTMAADLDLFVCRNR
jgi:hypothetical protein